MRLVFQRRLQAIFLLFISSIVLLYVRTPVQRFLTVSLLPHFPHWVKEERKKKLFYVLADQGRVRRYRPMLYLTYLSVPESREKRQRCG